MGHGHGLGHGKADVGQQALHGLVQCGSCRCLGHLGKGMDAAPVEQLLDGHSHEQLQGPLPHGLHKARRHVMQGALRCFHRQRRRDGVGLGTIATIQQHHAGYILAVHGDIMASQHAAEALPGQDHLLYASQ